MDREQSLIRDSNSRQVGLLIRKGADLNIRDFNDSDLLSIALDRADADIVTL